MFTRPDQSERLDTRVSMSLRCHNVRLTRCRGSDQRAPIQLSKTSIESGQRPRERRTTNMIASSEFTTILGTCRHPSPLIKRMRRRASHTHNTTRTVIRQVAVHDGNRPPTQHRAVSTEPSAHRCPGDDEPPSFNANKRPCTTVGIKASTTQRKSRRTPKRRHHNTHHWRDCEGPMDNPYSVTRVEQVILATQRNQTS